MPGRRGFRNLTRSSRQAVMRTMKRSGNIKITAISVSRCSVETIRRSNRFSQPERMISGRNCTDTETAMRLVRKKALQLGFSSDVDIASKNMGPRYRQIALYGTAGRFLSRPLAQSCENRSMESGRGCKDGRDLGEGSTTRAVCHRPCRAPANPNGKRSKSEINREINHGKPFQTDVCKIRKSNM
jgi:hypothetical protein